MIFPTQNKVLTPTSLTDDEYSGTERETKIHLIVTPLQIYTFGAQLRAKN